MTRYLAVVIILLTTGCAGVSTLDRPGDYYPAAQVNDSKASLFRGIDNLLSDKEIERILNFQLKIPKMNRIAILKLSHDRYWQNYSRDFNYLTESVATDFVSKLRDSARVYDASFLPGMLIPEKRTIPFLREAAARYQADLLLAYRTNCRTFEKYKFFSASETKAYCSVEVILLDVRSGIVPFTALVSNEFEAKKKKDDVNFHETIKKAELVSISKSLKDVAERINSFLDNVGEL